MNLRLYRRYQLWVWTRDPRQLWSSIPALLAIAGWLVLIVCLTGWRPDTIEAGYSGKAQQALAGRDFETARIAAQRLLATGVKNRDEWLFKLALSDAGLGRDREASALFNAVAPLDRPGYLPAQLFVAQALLVKTNVTPQDIKTAEQHLLRALSQDPSSPGANEVLARLYIRDSKWGLASERLLQIASDRPEAALLLAAVEKARGNPVEGRTYANQAVQTLAKQVKGSPADMPKSRLAWAEGLTMLDDYAEAYRVLEEGCEKSVEPGYRISIGEICNAWARSVANKSPGDLETRLDIIQKGLKYAPQNAGLIKQLVNLSRRQGNSAESARAALEKILAEGKSTAVVHLALGMEAWQNRNPALAREHFALSFETAPQMPEVANNMAMILAVSDPLDLPRALAIIQSVLEKYPDQPNFRETRGQIFVKLGRWQEAILDLEYALPKLSSTRGTHEALAEAYQALGSQPLAAQHLRLAKASSGDNPPTRD